MGLTSSRPACSNGVSRGRSRWAVLSSSVCWNHLVTRTSMGLRIHLVCPIGVCRARKPSRCRAVLSSLLCWSRSVTRTSMGLTSSRPVCPIGVCRARKPSRCRAVLSSLLCWSHLVTRTSMGQKTSLAAHRTIRPACPNEMDHCPCWARRTAKNAEVCGRLQSAILRICRRHCADRLPVGPLQPPQIRRWRASHLARHRKECPAASYSPTPSPGQYHRRRRA